MFKKMFVLVLVLALVLTTASIAFAGKGPGSGGGGGNGGGGGGGDIPDTGELYGDLYVILRDEYGLPIYDTNGCIQPISSEDGEPFQLVTDLFLDLECELTEDLAGLVQTVDFGRLNLGRAPDAVINHAFDEAINKMNAATGFGIDPAGRLMLMLDGEWFTIDAPAENLALYIKMMTDGHWITPEEVTEKGRNPETEYRPVLSDAAIALLPEALQGLGDDGRTSGEDLTNEELLLAASLLAASADKTGTMTLDKVMYINSIYRINEIGTKVDEKGIKYFNFGARVGGDNYGQDRDETFGSRSSGETCEPGYIWVLQPEIDDDDNPVIGHYVAWCVYIKYAVQFNDWSEVYDTVEPDYETYLDNVRGFVQSADDALQVLEYIHNYKVPVDLYATE